MLKCINLFYLILGQEMKSILPKLEQENLIYSDVTQF